MRYIIGQIYFWSMVLVAGFVALAVICGVIINTAWDSWQIYQQTGWDMTLDWKWIQVAINVSFVCSILHSFLPPWDAPEIGALPTFQKWYRLFIYFLGYLAVSIRSRIYPQIGTDNGSKLSAIALDTKNHAEQNNRGPNSQVGL